MFFYALPLLRPGRECGPFSEDMSQLCSLCLAPSLGLPLIGEVAAAAPRPTKTGKQSSSDHHRHCRSESVGPLRQSGGCSQQGLRAFEESRRSGPNGCAQQGVESWAAPTAQSRIRACEPPCRLGCAARGSPPPGCRARSSDLVRQSCGSRASIWLVG